MELSRSGKKAVAKLAAQATALGIEAKAALMDIVDRLDDPAGKNPNQAREFLNGLKLPEQTRTELLTSFAQIRHALKTESLDEALIFAKVELYTQRDELEKCKREEGPAGLPETAAIIMFTAALAEVSVQMAKGLDEGDDDAPMKALREYESGFVESVQGKDIMPVKPVEELLRGLKLMESA